MRGNSWRPWLCVSRNRLAAVRSKSRGLRSSTPSRQEAKVSDQKVLAVVEGESRLAHQVTGSRVAPAFSTSLRRLRARMPGCRASFSKLEGPARCNPNRSWVG